MRKLDSLPFLGIAVVAICAGLIVGSNFGRRAITERAVPVTWTMAVPVPGSPQWSSIEQAEKAAQAQNADGGGTCFPIAVIDGRVAWLTCAHVVLQEPTHINLRNGDRMPIIGSAMHPTRDAGIVWTMANPAAPVVPVPLADRLPRIGSVAVHAGYPGNSPLWLSTGLVGTMDEDGDLWSSVPIYFGCSGGPVIVDGEAVGIAMAVAQHAFGPGLRVPLTSFSCFVPVASVRDWIDETLKAK